IYNIIIKSEIYKKVKIIKFHNLKRWDIYLKNNVLIKFGNYNIAEQIHILESVIKKYKNFNVIDLRNERNAIIK
ncbi:cell division protein FtsQ/DivIB, partial [Candidatus Pelagibacter sp. HIMB1517]|uniref:cell division protein FtsQ/DivIB n=1 Tax=Candidatus Pelagibacter sp. HIMB1517 TaxID=3413341 RepID=UPI003F8731FF